MSLYLGENCISSGGSSAFRNNNIGEIIQSTIPLTDAGLHLLDGSLISGSGAYADFVTYIAGLVSSYPDLFTTEVNWQSSVSTYGVCGKFVYDSVNNTVRLPKLYANERYLIKSYSSGTDWYRIYSDGWCEQGGRYTIATTGTGTITFHKAFVDTNYTIFNCKTSADSSTWNVMFDVPTNWGTSSITIKANLTGYTLGGSWQAEGYVDISDYIVATQYEYIVIATSVKTEIEVDIDEVMSDLNLKANTDLNNITQSGKNVMMNVNLPDYSSVTTGSLTNYTGSITLTKKSMVIVSCQVGAYKVAEIYVNGNIASLATNPTGSVVYCTAAPVFADVGDIITFNSNWSSTINYYTYPLKGAS